ncbi:MAG: aldo/keto reductase [Anaerolineales bacterium]
METKKLGWTDLELTRIGLGTWAIGGGDWDFAWGPQDDEQSIETIHKALDLGINWIDTAAVYGFGHSEEVVGRAIKGMSERPIIATKCSRLWTEDGEIYGNLERESILAEAERSLDRLGIEVIDLYQIHWPFPNEGIEEGWHALEELIDSGKVRYGGVSNFSVSQMQRAHEIHPIASLQPPYSMLQREVEEDILLYCAENDIGVIVYSPMQKGLLTGKVDKAWVENLPEDDHRKADEMFNDPELSINLELVEGLQIIAERAGRTVPQLAIAWTLRRPEVTAAIVGARRPDQIEETAPAAVWNLTQDELAEIDRLLIQRENKLAQA